MGIWGMNGMGDRGGGNGGGGISDPPATIESSYAVD